MAIKIGSTDVTDIKVGGTSVDKVMVGSTVVWEKEVATTGGKWTGTATAEGSTIDLRLEKSSAYEWYKYGYIYGAMDLKNNCDGTWRFYFNSVSAAITFQDRKSAKELQFNYYHSGYNYNVHLTWSAS